MGWIITLARITAHKVKAAFLDFIFEITLSVLSIITVLVLWNSVFARAPTEWTSEMVLAFALFVEFSYTIAGITRRIVRTIEEYYVRGWIEPFLRPGAFLYAYLERADGGEIVADVLRFFLLTAVIIYLFPTWWLGLLALAIATLFYTGFEMFVTALSALTTGSGRLAGLFYFFIEHLIGVPADLFRGVQRFIVTVLLPIFAMATFPTRMVMGLLDNLTIILPAAVLWFTVGYFTLKKAVKEAEAYGG